MGKFPKLFGPDASLYGDREEGILMLKPYGVTAIYTGETRTKAYLGKHCVEYVTHGVQNVQRMLKLLRIIDHSNNNPRL